MHMYEIVKEDILKLLVIKIVVEVTQPWEAESMTRANTDGSFSFLLCNSRLSNRAGGRAQAHGWLEL